MPQTLDTPEKIAPRAAPFTARLFQPIDIASLVVFRVAFGAIMVWEAMRYLVPREPDGVPWARQFYIEPQLLFKYYGFGWVHPWPGDGMIYHFWAWAAAAACVMVGLCYRLAAAVLFLLVAHAFLLDQTRYLNHMYLICLLCFLLISLPLNRAASVDARLWPAIRSDVAPAWTLWLLRFQIGVVYVFSGIARSSGDWVRGEPMRTWLRTRSEDSTFAPLLASEWAPYFFSFGGILFDLLIVPALLWRRTRAVAFCAAVFFHLANAYVFHIGVFPWLGIAATTLFLEPDWPRRVARWWKPKTAIAPLSFPIRRITFAALALYAVVHLLVPLRHLAYPGHVSWTLEGHNFAWRMKLDARQTRIRIDVVNPLTGERRPVDLSRFLTLRQQNVMSTRPDMLVQFAHHVADHYAREFGARPRVYADVEMSLNGRPMKQFIDPQVDLASRRVSLKPADWIVHHDLEPLGDASHRADARRLGE